MRTFAILTSRGSSVRLEFDDVNGDDDLGLDDAVDTAAALHREATWLDTTVDGVVTGTYRWNGQDVRIAVIETTPNDEAAASFKDSKAAIDWVTGISH